jgi:hypothetical protein
MFFKKGLTDLSLIRKLTTKNPRTSEEMLAITNKYLTTPPTLVVPKPHENLQLYILATSNMVSTVIVVETVESNSNHNIQYPVYFMSEVLCDSKTWYFHVMKPTYALLITSCKLSHYFQAHQIEVILLRL